MKRFLGVLKKAPNYKGTVYRGAAIDEGVASLKVGKKHVFKELVSSSAKLDVAEEFASMTPIEDIVVYELKVKTAKDISKFVTEEFGYLAERLITRNTQFRILNKKFVKSSLMHNESGGYWHVVMEEI